MKTIRSTHRPNGTTRLIIELEPDEGIRVVKEGQDFAIAGPGEKLVKIDPSAHYSLGEPMREDIFAGHILADATPAHWCSLTQQWEK